MLESADRGAASTEPFDAVLTDVSVKGIGGLDLLRFARHVDGDMPVVLMADARDVESAAEAVEHGAFQYLLKPLPQGRVIDALEKAIRRRRELRAAAMESLERTVETAEPDRERWENALRTVWMAYQPIVLPSGKLYAYEALVRSEEPTLAGAGPLLDMADALNGVRDLGRVVRRRAGDFAVKAAGSHYLFVNLHADDLLDELLTSPSSPLSQVAPAVVLEITERAAMHDIEEAKVKMAELRSLGFRIALDDLGAGYAGLTSFVHVKPEIVKLDMALVRDIDKDPLRRKLVASVIQVSRDIGTLVVGEGVETRAERDVLVDLGCHLLQGYLFGKPERR
jgi:EAL domain-containing protein (putative c-di-GMP-specific phosphodiesterase class I)